MLDQDSSIVDAWALTWAEWDVLKKAEEETRKSGSAKLLNHHQERAKNSFR